MNTRNFIAHVVRSPLSSMALVIASAGMAMVYHPFAAFFSLVGIVWMRHQTKSATDHSTTADWLLGRSPRKSSAQQLGALLQASLDRQPPVAHLPELKVVVRLDQREPTTANVEFRNEGSFWIKDLTVSYMNVMELLAPSVTGWDVRYAQLSPESKQEIARLGEEIKIDAIGPGAVVTVCRTLMPGIAPAQKVLGVDALVERDGTAGTKRLFRVQSSIQKA